MAKKKALDIKELKQSYDSVRSLAEKCLHEISNQLKQIIDDQGLKLGFPIQARVKSWNSIKEKVINQNLKLRSIEDLQDLIGFRTVFLYKRDLLFIEETIKETFIVKKQYDTFDRLAENQFGYSSIHFVVQLPKSWLDVPSLSQFSKFSAEIQTRTLAQHIWAEVSHKLQYKSTTDVPNTLIRPIYRASALLETVDLEFERLLVDREQYRKDISRNNDQDLNVDNIEQILDEILPAQNKDQYEEYAELHNNLISNGIKSTTQLKETLNNHLNWVINEDKSQVQKELDEAEDIGAPGVPPDEWERVKGGYYFTHIGLVRVILKKIMEEK